MYPWKLAGFFLKRQYVRCLNSLFRTYQIAFIEHFNRSMSHRDHFVSVKSRDGRCQVFNWHVSLGGNVKQRQPLVISAAVEEFSLVEFRRLQVAVQRNINRGGVSACNLPHLELLLVSPVKYALRTFLWWRVVREILLEFCAPDNCRFFCDFLKLFVGEGKRGEISIRQEIAYYGQDISGQVHERKFNRWDLVGWSKNRTTEPA